MEPREPRPPEVAAPEISGAAAVPGGSAAVAAPAAPAVPAMRDFAWPVAFAVHRKRRLWRMRFEVATRGGERAVVPMHLCCACGHTGIVADLRGDVLHVPVMRPRGSALPEYDFPLCRRCAQMKSLRAIAMYSCIGICTVATAALGIYGWAIDPEPRWLERLVQLVVMVALAAGVGGAIGLLASILVGLKPEGRRANRVIEAAAYEMEPARPGSPPDGYRCFFRFTSEVYAAEFARANARILLPPRA